MVQGGVFLPRHLPTPSQNARHSSRLIIVGAVALTIAALVLVASSSAPSSLLELAGRPVEFVEAPTGAQYTAIPVGYQQPGVAYQQYQQPALAYSPYQQAPLRTQYVTYAAPSTGYPVASGPVQQVVQQPAALSPLQSEQQLSAGAKQAMNAAPSAKTIKAGKADEVSLLRKELHKASAQVDHYERHVRYLENAAAVEERRAKAALHEVDKAKNAAAFANAERAAAKRLEDIAATAKDHLIRKKAVADSLRPVVQRKVTLSRAMASRAQRETAAIASTQEAEQRDRYLLRKQLHLAADATRRAHIASSSIAAMKKRAAALRQEATADDAEADKDIKTARASVEGARKSAAATLRAIQASLHGGKAKSTKQKANASKLANSARTATRLMSTDKAKAKTLRSEAADERRRARQLSQQIAQREEEVPSDQQAALLAKNQATRLRASLERHVINGLPFNNDVQTSEQLAQTASFSAAAAVNSLAVSSAQQQRATRIFQKAKVFADREDDKAVTDAKTATTRLQQATKLFKVHDARRRLYVRKMAKLKGVLASSREELAALQNEATDIA